MRGAALVFLIEHWQFFLGLGLFGLAAWGGLRAVNAVNQTRRAREEEAQSRALDAEMAKIRANLAAGGGQSGGDGPQEHGR